MTKYHYTECGLENVYLENGFTFHDTPYGMGVAITDTETLHKAIGRWLIDTPKPLTGAELRFLRIDMELTQRSLAGLLAASEQCVQRWERAKKANIPGSPDRLMRAIYAECLDGDGSVRRMVQRLAELDEIPHPKALLKFSNTRKWAIDLAPVECLHADNDELQLAD